MNIRQTRTEAVLILCDAAGRAMGKDTKEGWRNPNMGQGSGGSSDILYWAEGLKWMSGKIWFVMYRKEKAGVEKENGGEKWTAIICCSLSCETVKQ